jgi:1-acyl-sn-glycerol-3-phosphate acyltransferase
MVRAERRYQELLVKFPHLSDTTSLEQVQKDLEERDQTDMNRAISPLKQAPDAHLIDTSYLSIDQVVGQIIALADISPARMKVFYRCIYLLAKGFFKLFFRLKIYGVEHFVKGSGVIAANHCSYYDPPVLSISCPEEVHFLAKESLFHVFLLGPLIRALNSHPIARGASDAQTFRTILKLLQQGKKVILFPEGNRSYDGELQPIERGLSFLVQKARCTIFPAYLAGTHKAWPRTSGPKLFGKIVCVFGSPIHWAQFEGLDKREAERQITEKMNQSLHNLKAWLEAGAHGTPP